MLVEEGFEVVSVDASDKMLKHAIKTRWERRKESNFDKWGKFLPNSLKFSKNKLKKEKSKRKNQKKNT